MPRARDHAAASAVAIGLGSNVGDRVAHLRAGVVCLRELLDDLRCSAVYETDPVGRIEQPPFLNAACVGHTRLTPRQLLSSLQDAERRSGRRREGPDGGPRTLDLDLLLYGDRVIDEPGLAVPHPRLRDRSFVLVPLRDIAADWWVPAAGGKAARTVAWLAEAAGTAGVDGTNWTIMEER